MHHLLPALLLLCSGAAAGAPGPVAQRLDDVSGERNDYNLSVDAGGHHRVFARSEADFAAARIHESVRRNGRWSTPVPVAFSDTRWRDSDPWLTPDGRTLYFISDRPAPARAPRRKDLDLWRAQRTGDGWSAPEHLGGLNSEGEELGPELHDGVLYFSSSRKGGMGGLDLYAARRDGDGFATPEPLPAPLNSATSESDFTLSGDGRQALFWRVVDGRLLLHATERHGDGWAPPQPQPGVANPGPMQITPAWSADGKALVFASSLPRAGQAEGMFDLYRVAWPLR